MFIFCFFSSTDLKTAVTPLKICFLTLYPIFLVHMQFLSMCTWPISWASLPVVYLTDNKEERTFDVLIVISLLSSLIDKTEVQNWSHNSPWNWSVFIKKHNNVVSLNFKCLKFNMYDIYSLKEKMQSCYDNITKQFPTDGSHTCQQHKCFNQYESSFGAVGSTHIY